MFNYIIYHMIPILAAEIMKSRPKMISDPAVVIYVVYHGKSVFTNKSDKILLFVCLACGNARKQL